MFAKLDFYPLIGYNFTLGWKLRRGVRVVYGAALEKRCCFLATVGSNPTLSVERCWSGRSGAPGERVAGLPARGFESHPLRFFNLEALTYRREAMKIWGLKYLGILGFLGFLGFINSWLSLFALLSLFLLFGRLEPKG